MACHLTEHAVFSRTAEQGNKIDFSVYFLTLQEAVTRSYGCEISAAALVSEPCAE